MAGLAENTRNGLLFYSFLVLHGYVYVGVIHDETSAPLLVVQRWATFMWFWGSRDCRVTHDLLKDAEICSNGCRFNSIRNNLISGSFVGTLSFLHHQRFLGVNIFPKPRQVVSRSCETRSENFQNDLGIPFAKNMNVTNARCIVLQISFYQKIFLLQTKKKFHHIFRVCPQSTPSALDKFGSCYWRFSL